MSIKTLAAKWLAGRVHKQLMQDAARAEEIQHALMLQLATKARETSFGKDHGLADIQSHQDFTRQVPIRDYEALSSYVKKILDGEKDVLWPGSPAYLAKTSGTTSGTKYIPITKASIPNHINTARNALLCYIKHSGKADFLNGNLIFLSGSPVLEERAGIKTGRLSGIVNHHVPAYLRRSQMPSYETNVLEDWEEKVERIAKETLEKDMTLISGIPPWVQMYFDRLQALSGKTIKELFPNFQLMVHGGVNFRPYRAKLEESIGGTVDMIETYPASEGFIAFQDSLEEEGLLLNINSGIFFEFIPLDEIHAESPSRLTLDQVELGKSYVVIINSNAGLWGYNIGDTVKFVSKSPYRVIVSGRVKHYISAFGEHVIGEEVSSALTEVAASMGVQVIEFTVAPQITPKEGLPHHEWFIEFARAPEALHDLEAALDIALRKRNAYYDDLIKGKVLRPLSIRPLKPDAFITYMKSIGKLGGQNKVPQLANDRKIADVLGTYVI